MLQQMMWLLISSYQYNTENIELEEVNLGDNVEEQTAPIFRDKRDKV